MTCKIWCLFFTFLFFSVSFAAQQLDRAEKKQYLSETGKARQNMRTNKLFQQQLNVNEDFKEDIIAGLGPIQIQDGTKNIGDSLRKFSFVVTQDLGQRNVIRIQSRPQNFVAQSTALNPTNSLTSGQSSPSAQEAKALLSTQPSQLKYQISQKKGLNKAVQDSKSLGLGSDKLEKNIQLQNISLLQVNVQNRKNLNNLRQNIDSNLQASNSIKNNSSGIQATKSINTTRLSQAAENKVNSSLSQLNNSQVKQNLDSLITSSKSNKMPGLSQQNNFTPSQSKPQEALKKQIPPKLPYSQLNRDKSSLFSGLPSTKAGSQSSSKDNFQIISKQFSGVGLYHQVPTNFTIGEFFKFNGIVLRPDLLTSQGVFNYNFLNIVFSSWGNGNQFRCTQPLSKKNLQFQVSCKMEKQGRFFLSIFPGMRGQSSSNMRMIQSEVSWPVSAQSSIPPTPENLKLDVIDNNLWIQWDSYAAITNLTIYQKTPNRINKKQFILSNYHQRFRIPYSQFQSFQPQSTYVEISHANSRDGTLCQISSKFSKTIQSISFEATYHAFGRITEDKVSINPTLPWRLQIGQKMKFNAVFNEPVKNEVLITMPNRKIFTVWFNRPSNGVSGKSIISPGTSVSLQLAFTSKGTHIIEINAATGMALVNRPIYIGAALPLIPDYEDLVTPVIGVKNVAAPKKALEAYVEKSTSLNKTIVQPPPESPLSAKRQFLLQLLNALRRSHGVGPVILNEKLNALAQSHSDDMKKNNYFSHTSLNGYGPAERAKARGITSSLGQNIAQSNSLIQAHLSLERSADHLENSIKSMWSRAGIGIAHTKVGQYLVSFQFSTRDLSENPLTDQQLDNCRHDVISLVRNTNGGIGYNNQISNDITAWMRGARSLDLLQSLVKDKSYKGTLTYTSFQISYSDDWIERLKTAGYLSNKFSSFRRFGVGLYMKKSDPNMIEGCAVFN